MKGKAFLHVHLLDTAVATDNIGDEIIVNSAKKFLSTNFADAYVTNSSSHDGLGKFGRQLAAEADIIFLLGTNALSATYKSKGLLPLQRKDLCAIEGKVVLFGVGASDHFSKISPRQAKLLSKILSRDYVHSVRDETALDILKKLGFMGLNTGCPTMWSFDEKLCFKPGIKPTLCFSLTHYRKSPLDVTFIEKIGQLYDNLVFWPQQIKDIDYLECISPNERITILPPNLEAYEEFLKNADCDVAGSRLHGGIHALKFGRKSIIVAVDNRAHDIGLETDLPVIEREYVQQKLEIALSGETIIDLSEQKKLGSKWLKQFSPKSQTATGMKS